MYANDWLGVFYVVGEKVLLSRRICMCCYDNEESYTRKRETNQAFSSHLVPRIPSFSSSESSMLK